MTAHDQIRKMLDELMGTARDGHVAEDAIPFSDHRVCRSFLLGCCPHDTLCNTRMDIGHCAKIHDPALKADFEMAQKKKDLFYDLDVLEHLERFFDDWDRKIEISKTRLEETQDEVSAECKEKADKVAELNEVIGKTLAEAERLGEEGKVEESLKWMEKVEETKKLKQEAEQEYRESMPASSYQQQKLRACDLCGAFLGIHDNDRRLADHFGGKLHMGFVFLREKMAELKGTSGERRVLREQEREKERELERSRRKRSRSRSRDRSRSHRSRSKRSKSRDSSRRYRSSRDSRSGSRSQRRDSRDKERARSKRDRSKSRERDAKIKSSRHKSENGTSKNKVVRSSDEDF